MEQMKYMPRIVDTRLREYLGTFGVVCMEGPKQME